MFEITCKYELPSTQLYVNKKSTIVIINKKKEVNFLKFLRKIKSQLGN